MNLQKAGVKRAGVNQLRVGWVLFKRDLLGSLLSPAVYIVITVSCLLSTFFVGNYLNTIDKLSVTVSVDPSSIPLFFTVSIMALYLGLTSSVSITSEREHRTLEVLFYGPVNHFSFVLSKFFRDLAILLLSLAFFTFYLFIESYLTNLAFGPDSIGSICISFFLIWPIVSFSLFLSAAVRRVRNSVLLFIAVFLALAGLQITYALLLGIPSQSISLFLLYIRETLAILLTALQWISPFSYLLGRSIDMGLGLSNTSGWYILFAVLYSALLLGLANLVLKRRKIYG